MVNVGTGNLIVQSDDMAVPHKGVALAFRRTYNSQSGHDVAGTDGTPPGLYGNGWTNTFDAHLMQDNVNHVVSVYDIDGARYDYQLNAAGNGWIPPPGQHASLTFDGGCGYDWQKKNGTTYVFYVSDLTYPTCNRADLVGYDGRLFQILGRNRNTNITFTYSWDNGNGGAGGKISQIAATTESGLRTTLAFADFAGVNGTQFRALQTLTTPDGTIVSYQYGPYGTLRYVTLPPNNSAGNPVVKAYGAGFFGNGGSKTIPLMNYYASPRWNHSPGTIDDGARLAFGYLFTGSDNAHGQLAQIDHVGFMDTIPADGTNTPLQPYPANGSGNASAPYLSEWFTAASIGTGSSATYRDSDGHYINWVTDAVGRPTQTQACTATQSQVCTGVYLITGEQWNADNDRIAETDARGYETDYAYDANGNAVAIAAPATSIRRATGTATIRPTRLLDYDTFNNIVAYCDEVATDSSGHNWVGGANASISNSDGACALGASGVLHHSFSYVYPAYEPFGEQVGITAPLGYHRTVSYDPARQGGTDFGLPTSVVGDTLAQNDGTSHKEAKSFAYDVAGNVVSYSAGAGTWSLTYDTSGRLLSTSDPDGISSYRSYFPDGSRRLTETSSQHALGLGVAYSYDLDGNTTMETHHFGCTSSQSCTPGTTQKWYDGADRLIEVQQPQRANDADFYAFPWRTRYIYDLSGGGAVTVAGTSAKAYGAMYRTQEFLGTSLTPHWSEVAGATTGNQPGGWQDASGAYYDAADRVTAKLRISASGTRITSNVYDSGNLGLLTTTCNGGLTDASRECRNLSYDERALLTQDAFNVATSATAVYTHDARGSVTSATSANGAVSIAFDADGNSIRRTQSSPGANAPDATITYHYYPDDSRASVDIAAATTVNAALSYSYRADGRITTLGTPASNVFTFTYSNAGRLLKRTDPGGETTTITLNPNGEPDSFTAGPILSESSIQYDAEREIVSAYPSWINRTRTASYSTRGEVLSELYTGSWGPGVMANGVRISTAVSTSTYNKSGTFDFDALAGVPLSISTPSTAKSNTNTITTFTYDFAGRLTLKSSDAGDEAKSYDVQNHLVTDDIPPKYPATYGRNYASYVWGPTQHPFLITNQYRPGYPQAPGPTTRSGLFWDGDELLFTTDDSGQINDIKIGSLADYVPNGTVGLTIWDRDTSGQMIGCHNSSGAGTAAVGVFHITDRYSCTSPGTNNGFWSPRIGLPGNGGILIALRSDGFSDGTNTIQGVRSYDSAAAIWTAPDAYSGDVHDPASQKAYMWNHNNPYVYSDPTGYDALQVLNPNSAMGFGHERIVVYDPGTGKGVEWSQGPAHDGRMSDTQTITKTAVPDVRAYVKHAEASGQPVHHVTQSASMDAKENAYAQQRYDTQSSMNYNVMSNNCAEFVGEVMRAGGWSMGQSFIPNINLELFTELFQGTSATPATAPTPEKH